MAGGDLLNLLIERDTFEEDFGKFYVAEMVLAIEEAHRLGYIHRDVKVGIVDIVQGINWLQYLSNINNQDASHSLPTIR